MDITKNFENKGYDEIQIDLSEELLKSVILSFREFDKNTNLEDKNKTEYRFSEDNRISFGYRDKSDEEGFDNKCYFHFNPDILLREELKDNIYYQNFLDKVNTIYSIIEKRVLEIIEDFSKEKILNKSDFTDENEKLNLNMRILNYKPKENCKTLAKKHIDRGVFTLAIYETEDGLRFFKGDKISDVKYKENYIKIFPSERWNEFSNKKFESLEHDVIKKMNNFERSSIVVFVNPRVN